MATFKLGDVKVLGFVAANARSDELKTSASELQQSFEIILQGLRNAAWDPTDEDNLKHPMGRTAMSPPDGMLEDRADGFVKALQADDVFATPAFACISDFKTCRASGKCHVTWCIAAFLACLAERVLNPKTSTIIAEQVTMSKDNINIHNVVGPVNVKARLSKVTQNVSAAPSIPDERKQELVGLLDELQAALQSSDGIPDEDADRVVQVAEMIASEAGKKTPSKSFLGITCEGLKNAAKAIEAIAPSVLSVAGKIASFISVAFK